MAKVSVIIPSRNERFLGETINDIFTNAKGDIEIIAVLDGYWPDPPLKDYPNLTLIHRSFPKGMRDGINSGVAIAKGEYLLKTDAHCLFGEGFDEFLKADCLDDWVVIPRRYSLDYESWRVDPTRPPTDYHYLTCPLNDPQDHGLHGYWWRERSKDRAEFMIDDEMSSQGSCWFMTKAHYNRMGFLSEIGYGPFIQEFQEIGMKTWLSGGQVKVNKKTFYAHLHKGKVFGRGYSMDSAANHAGIRYSSDFWVNNRWTERVHDFKWLIEKFWPVPTWPDDWEKGLYG